ncbi:Transmembrane protein 177 like protein [Argiope bruennichi]|uniref:Transmembrane protein 177 like protein n=1 Tax=Argiope bruennichi TaxID=94029 RepID=A0A8T0E418_ARGBR|nr:Transmembrane protein 177 like protein [Argiope bruennichi]
MSRLVSWFSTPKGRIFTRTCIGITGLSIFGIQVAVNGPLQENFKEMIQIYENGLGKSCKFINKKKKMKFFNVIGQDLGTITWCTNSTLGAYCIPFFFEDPKDISFAKLRIEGHESIDWIVDGQDLLDALTLSDNAKKFGLMREIYSCNIWDVMDNVSVSTGCFFFPALFIRRMNAKRDYLGKSAAAVGPEYLDGGIEFYKKALLQNKALRELLGPRGEKLYDKDGNENYVLLAPKLPLRKRLELLQEMKATEWKTFQA